MNLVKEIFEKATNMIDDAYMMIITELADGNATIEDLEFLYPYIDEQTDALCDLEISLFEDIKRQWIGDIDGKSD